jgi:hypothetical protein
MKVEFVAARAGAPAPESLEVPRGTTAAGVLAASSLGRTRPELLGADAVFGIGGIRVDPARPMQEGERLELLKPLAADPFEARRERARRRGPPR